MGAAMIKNRANTREVTAAERGQIVQRILVDGWTSADAARVFGVGEREVVRWLAAYRRRGMASLRDDSAAKPAPRRWFARLRTLLARARVALGSRLERAPATCVALRRDRATVPPEAPGRRSRWN